MSIYGLLIGIAFAIGAQYFSKKNNIIPKDKETVFIILLFISSIISARIYSVISDWTYYQDNLIQIFNTRAGGLGIYGGLLGGIIYVYIFSKIHHIKFINITNLLVPIIPLGQSIGRWGNFINTEVFGIPTYIDIGQYIPENLRPIQFQNYSFFHPVWLYESILDFVLFLILIKTKKNHTAIYLIGYGVIRFLLEFLRWDTFTINHIKIGQILSLSFILFGFMIISLKKVKTKKYGRIT